MSQEVLVRRKMYKREGEIAERITKYLREKPDAGDTLEGISKFWLEIERIDQSVDEVKNALDILIKKNVVVKIERKGNMPIYKAATKGE